MADARPTLAVIGDVHASFERLERVLDRVDQVAAAQGRLDAILLVGDLACAGHGRQRTAEKVRAYKAQVAQVLAAVRRRGHPFHFVPGNHDLRQVDDPANADGRLVSVGGARLWGLGGAGPDLFGFAYEWPEEEIRAMRVPRVELLLCHAPPRDTAIDRIHDGRHVGSSAVRDLALRTRGVLLCGHIHEAAGMERLGDCLCLNVGALGTPFPRTTVGFVLGLDHLVLEDLDTGARQEWRR